MSFYYYYYYYYKRQVDRRLSLIEPICSDSKTL